jgi:branched-chain amino acid transport system substrate-binding protein
MSAGSGIRTVTALQIKKPVSFRKSTGQPFPAGFHYSQAKNAASAHEDAAVAESTAQKIPREGIAMTCLSRRALLKSTAGSALLAAVGMPAIVKAQADAIRIGHLTPLTGFLGPLGEYAVMGIKLAEEEVNAAGGVMGRKIELVMEDSVNPQTASAKAERLIDRDKVAMIIGEISSASGLAIGQVANRMKTVFINTGCNSDALRGASCNPYMFHIEGANSMYVMAVGQYLLRENMVKGKKWYSLTADYAFGHDLLRVAKKFMEANGGQFAADELVPTDATDFSPYLLKIRQSQPDLVVSNLAGNQITNFIKQYSEYGLKFPVAGFGFDTVVAWGLARATFRHLAARGIIWSDTPSSGNTSKRSRRNTASFRTTNPGATTTR